MTKKKDLPYGKSLFLVEYVQSNWNLISTELLRWNRALKPAPVAWYST
ncbi:MAG: hypothetical protein M3Q79_00230 [bacterium]|nr:hypothetical protein [bacterium]